MGDRSGGLTRRKVLIGAGAATAGFGIVALAPTRAASQAAWEREADIIVVGSGAGASAAAIVAHDDGDAVVMVEKAPVAGGTSARSAGVMWIPDNFALRAKGIRDGKEDCLRYMARFAYPERYDPGQPGLGIGELEHSLLAAFYDNAAAGVERLRAAGVLKLAEWRGFGPEVPAIDYLDQVPENKVPTGRALGPLKEDGSMGLGVDLVAQFGAGIAKRGIPMLLRHRVMRLVRDAGGRVVGVEAEADGRTVRLRARKAVIFATGGYAHDPELVATHQQGRFWGACAAAWSTGDFIRIAGAAGARMGNLSGAWRTQVVFEEALKSPRLGVGVFYPPGDSMLQVNRHGRRVVNEHRNYNDRTSAHAFYDATAAEYPNQLLCMIYDRRTAEAFAGAYPLPADAGRAAHVLEGESLDALAAAIGRRLGEVRSRTGGFLASDDFAANLKATVERFNGFARAGVDRDFGRGGAAYDREWHRVFSPMRERTSWPANPGPNRTMYPFTGQGPYFGILLGAGALDTNGGPQIDASARVLDAEGRPIAGLYGAGNCIASPSRFAYFGAGHTLAMAVTFGAIAATAAHREVAAAAG
jgi:hypothetical protein